jgi:hypothetical protein
MNPSSSRVRIYWLLWLTVVALVLLLRFTVFRGAAPDTLFALGSTYAVGTWLTVMALNLIEGHRLFSFIEEHLPERWKWLTGIPFLGPGFYNGPRIFRWLFSKDDLEDPEVACKRTDYRRFLKCTLTVFLSYVVLMPILSI